MILVVFFCVLFWGFVDLWFKGTLLTSSNCLYCIKGRCLLELLYLNVYTIDDCLITSEFGRVVSITLQILCCIGRMISCVQIGELIVCSDEGVGWGRRPTVC